MDRTSALLAPPALLIAALAASCGGTAPDKSVTRDDATATSYLDADEFLNTTDGATADRFRALKQQLEGDFQAVCGDTFCESDFSNLRPLALNCAVTSKTGKLKGCQYSFAGSYQLVDARTGALAVTARTFTCKLPVTGTIKGLVDALLAAGATPALRRPLPGSTQTIYDALGGCLP